MMGERAEVQEALFDEFRRSAAIAAKEPLG